MLHVFDDCAHEHYHRVAVETADESHHEHSSTAIKRKLTTNQRAGEFKKKKKKSNFYLDFNRRSNN